MKSQRTKVAPILRSTLRLLVLVGFVAVSASLSLAQAGRQISPKSASAQLAPLADIQDQPVVINTDLVTVSVTVTDREGRHISGLEKKAFTVYDDKFPQEIMFFSDWDTPISFAVIFDTSNSMSGEKINRAREALGQFIETSHRQDEYSLISFSDRAQLLLDRTRDPDAMLAKFTYVRPDGETALYDAIYLGVEKVARGSRPRRAILLITDGNDTCSRYTFEELKRSLQESDVVLYAIGILAFSRNQARAGRTTLKALASVTGGKAFFPDGKSEMIEAFESIALELRSQYSIGYRPVDLTRERTWHRIKVEVKTPDRLRLVVRSREGAYFPE